MRLERGRNPLEIHIRNDEVNSKLVLIRKSHAAVDDDNIIICFNDGHVLSYLSQAAQ